MRATCKGCAHRIKTSSGFDICHYILDTGRSRDCAADNCDKYSLRKIQRINAWDNETANTWKARKQ